MKKLIAALCLCATPAMACTDWKAIAAFDVVLEAYDAHWISMFAHTA